MYRKQNLGKETKANRFFDRDLGDAFCIHCQGTLLSVGHRRRLRTTPCSDINGQAVDEFVHVNVALLVHRHAVKSIRQIDQACVNDRTHGPEA